MRNRTESSPVAGVVLAAGLSRRYGGERSKLIAELGGEALVRRVVRAALGSRLGQVLVVLGHGAEQIRKALAGLEVDWVENPAYSEGQSTSVRAGLEHMHQSTRAVLFLPADQPLLTSRLIDRMIAAWERSGGPIVRPRAGKRPASPVLWDSTLFGELADLTGDAGGRQLLPRHSGGVLEIEADDPRELSDVDTYEDLRALEEALRGIEDSDWNSEAALI